MYISPVILAEKVLKGTEKLTGTEIVSMTLIGLAVVFCALLVLVVFLYCSGSIFKKNDAKQPATKKAVPPAPAKKKSAEAKKSAPAKKTAPAKPAAASAAAGEDEEVIAVIMAAIAAMGAAEGKQYALRSVRQVTRGGSGRSVWAQAGIMDATRPF